MPAKKKTVSRPVALEPMTKEGLQHRLQTARRHEQLDAIEADARSIGYADDGVLLTALREKRDQL